ncbi:hypothetical protein P170DRAFT_455498 [Aspergillus steynii IBT 23096]|uniref:Uncharacterized protein n=1 Tax=Aspergillus steynii IBT 23096 TaxID=1392250 RepID=A0A2I2GEE1_9EURO|nr:uncharacterized protein P170DRAFT_455498 [Aspergillus steynii IBT 23096]PLB51265.1 hypothetical protein P170DRAFT_455498 [Aspergillus steynii IBT 23096]
MDLQPPSVLAQLPRPLQASTGKIRIGEVHGLADSKKRKRYEVAVAVDGEAVNIYNVQTPKLVTSYAVPPQSSFSCQPCSVRRKLSNKPVVKRQTYVAVNPQREIKSFVEESGGNGSTAPVISSSSFSVKDSDSPAIFVGLVPTASGVDREDDSFDVLAVHEDGRVRRLAADLATQRWSIRPSELAQGSSDTVRACFLVEYEDAKKALLKKRQDLATLALGDLTNSGVDEPSILLVVSHPTGSQQIKLNNVKISMFSVPGNVSQTRLDESQKLRHLITVSIPDIDAEETFESNGLEWDFHAASAGLNLSCRKGFINFDLSQYKPTATSKFILDDEEFSSVMRVSPQTVIGAGKSIIALFDTQYKSIQRSIAFDDVPNISSSPKAPTKFISYFAKLGIAVAAKGNILYGFDLSSSHATLASSVKRPRDGLLIDAIGRGIGSSASQWDAASKKPRVEQVNSLGLNSQEQIDRWNQLTTDLRESAKSKDAGAFDRAVQAYFNVDDSAKLPARGQYVNVEVTLFLLTFIFSVQDAGSSQDKLSASSTFRLSIDFWPSETCEWLIQLGHLSADNVEIALRRSLKPRILPSLPVGSFVQALIDSDATLQRLLSVLQGPTIFNPDELAYALKTFLNTAHARSLALEEETAKTLAITSGEEPDQPDQSALTTSTSTSTIQDALKDIFLGLNTTIQKIHAHPAPAITHSIRSALSRTDILSLVHHLRLSLAVGGHTTRFTENPPTPISPHQTTPTLSLDTIATLLNASVDAIGPSGWISASADLADAPTREMDLIADMKSEVSAALAGVEEAAYLTGILREYIRYTNNVHSLATPSTRGKASIPSSSSHDNTTTTTTTTTTNTDLQPASDAEPPLSTRVRHEKLNGADLMVFGAGDEGAEDGDAAGKLLPLSLKGANDVSRTKVKKSTGEVKARSHREIGYLKRKAVGKYSFERLIV